MLITLVIIISKFFQRTLKKAQCPFSSDHVIKSGDLDNHIQKCRSKQMGFTPFEVLVPHFNEL